MLVGCVYGVYRVFVGCLYVFMRFRVLIFFLNMLFTRFNMLFIYFIIR